ncbi:copper amine oxidase N-terminal domain-containing protein [Desulfoscipio gibsoniae]|uniref:Copper amine oxidase family protein n=1 Tax=Desulfoscipio gibsoniae DSM 7213 TaxID=767817 RepID=R4KIY7_9FIRM|nr:copper amine oxidase N-terminal domain-containing protein [Desulfoscipio gibsoniae]AGL02564.1 copper amine oxidase family protein [Desulfoscipio gibsoniae DSM 7213]
MKKWLAGIAAVVLLTSFAAVAAADKPIKLNVNGWQIKTDVPPQLLNGRIMVPVRWVAEALGADVKWEKETNNVWIATPDLYSLQQQTTLLQEALVPTTPQAAVEKWAEGVKTRNGALQFAMLSPELKEQERANYESFNWVTGTSSPWVEDYTIVKENKTSDGAWEYEVKFETATSTGPAGASIARVIVKQYQADAVLPTLHPERNWYITQIFHDSSLATWLKEQVKEFLAEEYQHYQVLETEVELLSQKVDDIHVEAEFKTKVTHVLGVDTPAQWPLQQGRIKYLEENRNDLTPEKIRLVEEEIAFWNQELQEYIDKPSDANDFLKITAKLDGTGAIDEDTIKLYSQDPVGNYLPINKDTIPAFKSSKELIEQGYAEMHKLLE